MTVTQGSLTQGSDIVAGSSATTASITPTSNALVLLAVAAKPSGANREPTASGNGLTWEVVNHVIIDAGSEGDGVTVLRAMGASPSAGAITIDFAGESQLEIMWSVVEFYDVETTGTNGSGAVVQSTTGDALTGTAMLATLAAFGSADNATYGAGKTLASSGTIAEGTGFTEIHQVSENLGCLQTQWRNDNDTTVSATASASAQWGMIGVEIKAGATGPAPRIVVPMRSVSMR